MTIYISQGRYTAAAIKGMSAKPEDRSEAVAELFAAAGIRHVGIGRGNRRVLEAQAAPRARARRTAPWDRAGAVQETGAARTSVG